MMQRQTIALTIMVLFVGAVTARAATASFSTTAPADANDLISSTTGAVQDRDNVGGDGTTDGAANDPTTYVAPDRSAQGQTFTTNNSLAMISGIWVRHPGYSGNNPGGEEADNTWYAMGADTTLTVRITDPSAAGNEGFVLASETAGITGTEPDVLPATTTNTADGTGTWIHLELDNPVAVAANTMYGFDLVASDGTFFEILGIRDAAAGGNPYTDGSAYISGADGAGDNTMTTQTGDRVFVVETVPFVSGAANPNPEDSATDVDSDAYITLNWDAGLVADTGNPAVTTPNPDILYHYVYLSRPNDPNLLGISPVAVDADSNPADGNVDATASYTLTSLLDSDSQYFWRVDEILNDGTGNPRSVGDPNNLTGTVWSFETEKKLAQLNPIYPADVAADIGEAVTFKVEATNPLTGDETGMTYQWYRNGAILTGETNAQYQRTIQSGDEGSTYYCEVTVTATAMTVQSRTATVIVKELLAYWSFDTTVNDITGNGNDGTHIGDPNYAAGKVNDALLLDGQTDYVDLPDGFSNFGSGLTITLWAQPTAAGSYARFIDWGNGPESDNIMLYRLDTSNTLAFNVYVADAASTAVEAADTLELDAWQFLVVTMDNNGNVVLYKNGVPVASGTVSVPAVVTRTDNFIGESNWEADALYEGLMDEIKLYNYPMTGQEIAEIYYQLEGEFCLEHPAHDISGPLGEPDCVVDVYDLAGLAETWLECGLYPDCP